MRHRDVFLSTADSLCNDDAVMSGNFGAELDTQYNTRYSKQNKKDP